MRPVKAAGRALWLLDGDLARAADVHADAVAALEPAGKVWNDEHIEREVA